MDKIWFGMSSSLPPPSEYLPAKAKVDSIILESGLNHSFPISPVSTLYVINFASKILKWNKKKVSTLYVINFCLKNHKIKLKKKDSLEYWY